jgi:hypothetical protein
MSVENSAVTVQIACCVFYIMIPLPLGYYAYKYCCPVFQSRQIFVLKHSLEIKVFIYFHLPN